MAIIPKTIVVDNSDLYDINKEINAYSKAHKTMSIEEHEEFAKLLERRTEIVSDILGQPVHPITVDPSIWEN